MTDLPILIREYRDTDKAFIVDSWVNSAVYSTPQHFWIPQKVIQAKYRAMIGRLIDARPELFRVLVNETDEDQIFAWVCGESGILASYLGDSEHAIIHFVYTKEEFRHNGLGFMLIRSIDPAPLMRTGIALARFTNWTKDCEKLDITYKPSLFKGLINGTNQTMGHRTAQTDLSDGKSLRENHTN